VKPLSTTSPEPPAVVWCVLDAKPGHKNLARGMIKALATVTPVECHEINPPRWTMRCGRLLQVFWPRLSSLVPLPRGIPSPDLVLGSGGNVLWFTAALAHRLHRPAVFVGSRRRLPSNAALFTHYDPSISQEGGLCLPILPGPFTRDDQETAWLKFAEDKALPQDSRHLVALVGGDGNGYHWREADGHSLARLMNELSRQTGRRWLVTTSRRTPPEFESGLISLLRTENITDACWFHRGDHRRVVAAYLGGAFRVLVGEDSMSMIHEALTSRQPVTTFQPAQMLPGKVHESYLIHAARQHWLDRQSLAEKDWSKDCGTFTTTSSGYPDDALLEAGTKLHQKLNQLGWRTA